MRRLEAPEVLDLELVLERAFGMDVVTVGIGILSPAPIRCLARKASAPPASACLVGLHPAHGSGDMFAGGASVLWAFVGEFGTLLEEVEVESLLLLRREDACGGSCTALCSERAMTPSVPDKTRCESNCLCL